MNNKLKRTPQVVSKILQRSAESMGSPEGNLWFAVLNTALLDFGTKKYNVSVARFFKSRHFDIICDHIGLNQDYAREQIAMIHIRSE